MWDGRPLIYECVSERVRVGATLVVARAPVELGQLPFGMGDHKGRPYAYLFFHFYLVSYICYLPHPPPAPSGQGAGQ